MELSLFPLHVVLFPGMALPLHIFEERYKRMIQRCLEGDGTFGVVLIREGSEVGAPATPFLVGTRARIINVERLPDGRMNLLTLGQERFRITRYWEEDGYLRGAVTFLEDETPGEPAQLSALVERTRQLLVPYLTALLTGTNLDVSDIPESEPVLLSFWAASLLVAPALVKQGLLEMTSTAERLEFVIELIERFLKKSVRTPQVGGGVWEMRVLGQPVFLN
ncbi:MAG: LON peptidase substrate-binding domain-containing protein [Abditibacteriales bacterium]|nr:LON peptidase substrate-binding domain-containing protein [Abditibacteriales bacterium]MDW8366524.1 LON peptidase substrate-binding domain-containing protein [Abditibacteriales bacterium]